MSAREIAAFILARLAEEEADARAAPSGPWVWAAVGASGYPQRITNGEAILIATCYENPDFRAACAEHITRQDPAATLVRVEALRVLVAEHPAIVAFGGVEHCETCSDFDTEYGTRGGEYPCMSLRLLATIWRIRPDGTPHPEYRAEWAP